MQGNARGNGGILKSDDAAATADIHCSLNRNKLSCVVKWWATTTSQPNRNCLGIGRRSVCGEQHWKPAALTAGRQKPSLSEGRSDRFTRRIERTTAATIKGRWTAEVQSTGDDSSGYIAATGEAEGADEVSISDGCR
jgi:hypothetical protein